MPQPKHLLAIGAVAIAIAVVVLVLATRRSDDRTTIGPHDDRARASGAAPSTPGEAVATEAPQLEDALRGARYQDAVELCNAPTTLDAHRADCTIAACRAHVAMKARTWFESVGDGDRARVEQACAEVHVGVTIDRPVRPHGRRHGEVD